ncbi:hypothetical protein STRDD13_01074 [Streptococcus sp. DD13]|nr:hypothetical protein STRDD13_01074 [Streptococcus sp. DD13]
MEIRFLVGMERMETAHCRPPFYGDVFFFIIPYFEEIVL